jgi:hypothetical protein
MQTECLLCDAASLAKAGLKSRRSAIKLPTGKVFRYVFAPDLLFVTSMFWQIGLKAMDAGGTCAGRNALQALKQINISTPSLV